MRHDLKIGLCGVMIVCVVCLCASCRPNASAQGKALSSISRLADSWKVSPRSFADLSHLACAEIEAVENASNRLECALAYQNAILALPKYLRECDEDGFWARLNAQTEIERITSTLDTESKWRFTVRWWRALTEELEHYDAYGVAKPMRLVDGVADSNALRKAAARVDAENATRKLALERRHYANRLRGCVRTMYRPIFEDALREDWGKIPIEHRDELMEKVREAVGRYPDWYLEDKGGQGDARKKK